MAEPLNPYYDKLINNVGSSDDSIFEPCRIEEVNMKTLMAKIYGTRSKQTKENVIILFPSLFMNSGIISVPAIKSFGLSFVGSDNETYLVPGQFIPPKKNVQNNKIKSNGSPAQYDKLLTLENIEPGEHLIKSLSGAQVYLRNTGEIELSTSKLHRLSLSEIDGALEVLLERERKYIGFYEYYNGAYEENVEEDSTFHHIRETIYEKIPIWESDNALSDSQIKMIADAEGDISSFFPLIRPVYNLYEMQKANVFDHQGKKKKSLVDDGELYSEEFWRNSEGKMRVHQSYSKEGALRRVSLDSDTEENVEIIHERDNFSVTLSNPELVSRFEIKKDRTLLQVKDTKISIEKDGDIEIDLEGDVYSFKELIARINQLSELNDLSPL